MTKRVKDLSSYKKGFEALTKQLQSKVGNAKRELKVLNQYEEMKKVIDNQILDQEKTYTEKQSVMEKQIELNKKSINRYMWLIEGKEQELEKEEKLARLMMKNEAEIERRLLSAMQNAKEFEEQSKGGRSAIANTLKKISEYKRLSEKSKVYIVEQKRDVTLLLEESQKYARNIADIKKKFLGKFSAMGKSEKSSITAAEVKKITASFNRLFNKKEAAEKLVNQLNTDLEELKKEFSELSNDAIVVKLSSKSKKVSDYVKEFEKKFDTLDKKKNKFRKEVHMLLGVFKNL